MTRIRRSIFIFLLGSAVGFLPFVLQTHYASSTKKWERTEKETDEWIVEHRPQQQQNGAKTQAEHPRPQRKILLDCGANTASTIEFFLNTYPDGREYVIHSFEIDSRLSPYFSPYPADQVHLHCPVGVTTKDGTMTAYTESAWSPDRGLNNGKDMLWGGGTLFVDETEAEDKLTGGYRKLSVRPSIPTIDLSSWIKQNTNIEDYVVLKLDVEGAEFDILRKMIKDGTFQWIDKLYGEFHPWQPVYGWTEEEMLRMMRVDGLIMLDWAAETRDYDDFRKLHKFKVSKNWPGRKGGVYSTCGKTSNKVALTVAVGMNAKRARKVISILEAYPVKIPIMLFVHGDFAELYSDDVSRWNSRFGIGLREDGHFPPGHFEIMDGQLIMESLVSSEMRLQELGVHPVYYLPMNVSRTVIEEAQLRKFSIIKPIASFPLKEGTTLRNDNYYQFRDVERTPKALRMLYEKLVQSGGGIITLDTDLPDTRLILVFLLDYLVEKSNFELVSIPDCVASYINAA